MTIGVRMGQACWTFYLAFCRCGTLVRAQSKAQARAATAGSEDENSNAHVNIPTSNRLYLNHDSGVAIS